MIVFPASSLSSVSSAAQSGKTPQPAAISRQLNRRNDASAFITLFSLLSGEILIKPSYQGSHRLGGILSPEAVTRVFYHDKVRGHIVLLELGKDLLAVLEVDQRILVTVD